MEASTQMSFASLSSVSIIHHKIWKLQARGSFIPTLVLMQVLRKKYPQFSQLQNGMHMQQVCSYCKLCCIKLFQFSPFSVWTHVLNVWQDAEECWTQLLYTLSQSLKAPTSSEGADAVKALFGVNLQSRYLSKFQISVSYLTYFICINHAFNKQCEQSSAVNSSSIPLRGILISWVICRTEGNTWNFVVTTFHFVIFYLSG